jgi:GDPmannose 4,6-dehydratase
MWLMLQQPEPDDYVLATGKFHSLREFIELAFAEVGRRIVWQGKGVNETGIDETTGKDLIKVDARYFRPTEVDELVGDASKAAKRLGWRPTKSFKELVAEMVYSDLKSVPNEAWRKDSAAY